jgi:uncharacterized repeat protein (TIGR04076 family)
VFATEHFCPNNTFSKKQMSNHFELYDLRVTVEAIEGRSVCGLQVGDFFDLTESSKLRIPPGKHFCIYALSAVLPLLAAKQRQLAAGDWLERDSLVACPDPEERLIMRIERLHKRTMNSDELT